MAPGPWGGRKSQAGLFPQPRSTQRTRRGLPWKPCPQGGSLRVYEVWFSSHPAKLLLHFLHILAGFMFSLREFCKFQARKGKQCLLTRMSSAQL